MTGHWQILGSARVPLEEMVGIDYLYVANWSLWTDIKILLRTMRYVARAAASDRPWRSNQRLPHTKDSRDHDPDRT